MKSSKSFFGKRLVSLEKGDGVMVENLIGTDLLEAKVMAPVTFIEQKGELIPSFSHSKQSIIDSLSEHTGRRTFLQFPQEAYALIARKHFKSLKDLDIVPILIEINGLIGEYYAKKLVESSKGFEIRGSYGENNTYIKYHP